VSIGYVNCLPSIVSKWRTQEWAQIWLHVLLCPIVLPYWMRTLVDGPKDLSVVPGGPTTRVIFELGYHI
jgi:hypothetical protein